MAPSGGDGSDLCAIFVVFDNYFCRQCITIPRHDLELEDISAVDVASSLFQRLRSVVGL